jgi:hypothetical protein
MGFNLFGMLYPDAPKEVTDANGDTWKGSTALPPRNGKPTYYNATGPDGFALTEQEIQDEIR